MNHPIIEELNNQINCKNTAQLYALLLFIYPVLENKAYYKELQILLASILYICALGNPFWVVLFILNSVQTNKNRPFQYYI